MKKTIVSLVLKLALVAVGIAGLVAACTDSFMSGAKIMQYFTIQSNIWIICVQAALAVYDGLALAGKRAAVPQWLYILKYMFTVSIMLTFLVFWMMLSPQYMGGDITSLLRFGNMGVHTYVPLLALVDFFVSAGGLCVKRATFLYSAVMPAAYAVFALVGSVCGLTYGDGGKVPYFFLDYERFGWFTLKDGLGVFWWILIVALGVMLIGYALIAFYRLRLRSTNARG